MKDRGSWMTEKPGDQRLHSRDSRAPTCPWRDQRAPPLADGRGKKVVNAPAELAEALDAHRHWFASGGRGTGRLDLGRCSAVSGIAFAIGVCDRNPLESTARAISTSKDDGDFRCKIGPNG